MVSEDKSSNSNPDTSLTLGFSTQKFGDSTLPSSAPKTPSYPNQTQLALNIPFSQSQKSTIMQPASCKGKSVMVPLGRWPELAGSSSKRTIHIDDSSESNRPFKLPSIFSTESGFRTFTTTSKKPPANNFVFPFILERSNLSNTNSNTLLTFPTKKELFLTNMTQRKTFDAKSGALYVVRAERIVSHVRVKIEELKFFVERFIDVGFQPAWGATANLWEIAPKDTQSWIPCKEQMYHQFPPYPEVSDNLVITVWNCMSAEMVDFGKNAMILKKAVLPKVMFFIEMRAEDAIAIRSADWILGYEKIPLKGSLEGGGRMLAFDKAAVQVRIIQDTNSCLELIIKDCQYSSPKRMCRTIQLGIY